MKDLKYQKAEIEENVTYHCNCCGEEDPKCCFCDEDNDLIETDSMYCIDKGELHICELHKEKLNEFLNTYGCHFMEAEKKEKEDKKK